MEPPVYIERAPEPDPRTVTGSFQVVRLVKHKKYGNREKDKPMWWVLTYHVGKAVVQILTAAAIFGILAWAKACGVNVPGGWPWTP